MYGTHYSEHFLQYGIALLSNVSYSPERGFIWVLCNSTMTGSKQSPPEAPPGIDQGVQSMIDVLFAQAPVANSNRRMIGRTGNNGAAVSSSHAATTPPRDIIDAHTSNRRLLPSSESSVQYLQSEGKMREESDKGVWHERAPWALPPLPRPQALTLFDDPSRVR